MPEVALPEGAGPEFRPEGAGAGGGAAGALPVALAGKSGGLWSGETWRDPRQKICDAVEQRPVLMSGLDHGAGGRGCYSERRGAAGVASASGAPVISVTSCLP